MVFIWLTRFSKKRITLVGLFLFLRLQSYRTHFTTTVQKNNQHAQQHVRFALLTKFQVCPTSSRHIGTSLYKFYSRVRIHSYSSLTILSHLFKKLPDCCEAFFLVLNCVRNRYWFDSRDFVPVVWQKDLLTVESQQDFIKWIDYFSISSICLAKGNCVRNLSFLF